jgi:hypothetical protein
MPKVQGILIDGRTGYFEAQKAVITGDITAETGYIGGTTGWTIAAGSISSVNGSNTTTLSSGGTNAFIAGPTVLPTITISHAGVLTATGAIISGTLTATAGFIGGWTINTNSITDTAGTVGLSSAITVGDDIRFWAGHATPASAPFKVTEAGVLTATSGAIGGWTLGATTLTGTGVTLSSVGDAYLAIGTTPPTGVSTGTGIFINKTGLFGLNANVQNFKIDATNGNITAIAGAIGGFTISSTALYAGNAATRVQLDTTSGIHLGATAFGDAPFSVSLAGSFIATSATITGAITATSGTIGSFTIGTYLYTGTKTAYNDTNAGVHLGSDGIGIANNLFTVSAAGVINAVSGTVGGCALGTTSIGSTAFVSGSTGWNISNVGTAEFENMIARGEFRTAVFVKDEIHATGGSLIILSASTLKTDFTSVTTPTTSTLDLTDPPSGHAQLFSVNDIIRIKDGSGKDNWLKVTGISDQTTFYRYTVDKQSGTNGTFTAGVAVVNYKQSTNGHILLTSDATNSPYIDIALNGATPWTASTLDTKVRLGWLQGIIDADVGLNTTDVWGLYTDNAYIKGVIVADTGYIGGTTGWTIATGSISSINGGNTTTIASGGTNAYIAGTTGSPQFIVTHAGALTAISADITGTINATAGYFGDSINRIAIESGGLNIGNTGAIRGGQTAYATGTGFFLGYSGSAYKFSLGNTANYFKWDGSDLHLSGTLDAPSGYLGHIILCSVCHGYISSGLTTYNSGSGFWIGHDVADNIYKISIGDGTVEGSMTWDGTNLLVRGTSLANQNIFGDGSDGDVTISADTTLSSDMYYNNLTINTTKILNTGGYRIFVKETLTINGTGKIIRNGNTGGNGADATAWDTPGTTGGAGGAALADGSIKGALAGIDGVNGVSGSQAVNGPVTGVNGTAGSSGVNIAKSLVSADGVSGKSGGTGGNGTVGATTAVGGTAGAAGSAGTRTGTVYNIIKNAYSAYLLYDFLPTGDNLKAAPSNGGAAAGSSGGAMATLGDGCRSGATGRSGGGGGNGGIVSIFAKTIINSGTISANGGAGGNAGTTWNSDASGTTSSGAGGSGGSSGGSGGNGGILILVYQSLTNTGTIQAIGGSGGTKAVAGTKATHGSGTATDGTDGQNGTTGNDGQIIYLVV